MPEKATIEKAKKALREGKTASTAAAPFVQEEIEHVREGKHGARSAKQAIAIGLSKARRAGVPLPPPKKGRTSERTRRSAELASEVGQGKREPKAPSKKRSRAVVRKLKQYSTKTTSKAALSKQAKSAARRRKRAEAKAA
jgi:hypothetical protein